MQSRRNTENWEPHTASLIYSESHWIALVGPVRRQANHSEIKVLLNTNTNGKMYSFPFWKLCFQFWMLQTASAYCFSLHSFPHLASAMLWPLVFLWAFGHCVLSSASPSPHISLESFCLLPFHHQFIEVSLFLSSYHADLPLPMLPFHRWTT